MTNTKEWTDRDLQILHSLYSSGLGSVEIAERLGRTEEEITGGLSIARQRVGAPPGAKPQSLNGGSLQSVRRCSAGTTCINRQTGAPSLHYLPWLDRVAVITGRRAARAPSSAPPSRFRERDDDNPR